MFASIIDYWVVTSRSITTSRERERDHCKKTLVDQNKSIVILKPCVRMRPDDTHQNGTLYIYGRVEYAKITQVACSWYFLIRSLNLACPNARSPGGDFVPGPFAPTCGFPTSDGDSGTVGGNSLIGDLVLLFAVAVTRTSEAVDDSMGVA